MKNEILIKPIITEKSLKLVEEQNKYTFIINGSATKKDVKAAVEKIFKVKVLEIKVLNKKGKRIQWGRNRIKGVKKNIRKAIVSLKSSDSIGLFKIK